MLTLSNAVKFVESTVNMQQNTYENAENIPLNAFNSIWLGTHITNQAVKLLEKIY